jgi:hypothetical protein
VAGPVRPSALILPYLVTTIRRKKRAPDPGADEVVTTRNTIQIPVAVCDTCTENPSIMIPEKYWTVDIMRA